MASRLNEMEPPSQLDRDASFSNRRQEVRVEDRHWYTYEIYESRLDGAEAVVEGRLLSLNRSAHGILVLMRESPHARQLIALYNPRLGWHRSTMVYEVCWVRALPIDSNGDQFLVGCRLTTAMSR